MTVIGYMAMGRLYPTIEHLQELVKTRFDYKNHMLFNAINR